MRIVLLFCVLLVIACGSDSVIEVSGEEQELYQNHLLLKAYFYHPERIKQYKEYRGMEVDSMYETLEDYFCGANYSGKCGARYTFYSPPEETDDKIHQIENTKRYYSFGFERKTYDKSGDTMVVSWVYPISPAASAGLRKKDRLLFANETSLIGLTREDLAAYLKNDEPFDNSTVFKVLRDGKFETLKAMQKGEIQKPTVYLDSIDGIPYIQISEYKVNTNDPKGTYEEFRKILQEIKGAKAAIMDLRGNPGGNIGHCTAMAAELVPLNNELIYDEIHYRDNKRGNVIEISREYARDYLNKEGTGVNIKWVILMSRGSASCSERFTAAVKYNRPNETTVIGQTSYGKGIGQIYTKTYAGGLAYITCLQTYYPNGKTFHNIGIIPDIPVEVPTDPDDEDAYNAYIDALRSEAIKAAKNFGAVAKRSTTPTSSDPLPPEVQLDRWEPGAYKRIEMPLFH